MANIQPGMAAVLHESIMPDDQVMWFGSDTTADSGIEPDTAQTNNAVVWWLGAGMSRTLMLAALTRRGDNYAFPAQTNPTLVIFSATAAATATNQYLSLTHNQTDVVITSGVGDLFLSPARAVRLNDNSLLTLGTSRTLVMINRSPVLAANAGITSVLVGTSVHPGVANNSFILSNTSGDGDIMFLGNRSDNSEAYLRVDSSLGNLELFSRGTGSFDVYDDTTQILDFVINTFAFQQATTISTASGTNLTLNAIGTGLFILQSGGTELLRGSNTALVVNESGANRDFRIESDTVDNIFMINGETAHIGFGVAAVGGAQIVVRPPAETFTADFSRASFDWAGGAVTTNTGVALVIGMNVGEPDITVGSATPTNAVSLRVADAPTEATNNYAFWVDVGVSRFDGNVLLNGAVVIRADTSTAIAFSVVNTALVIGSLGSMIMPVRTVADNVDASDAAIGDVEGAFYYNRNNTSFGIRTNTANATVNVALAGYLIQYKVPSLSDGGMYHPNQYLHLFDSEGRQYVDETLCVICGERMRIGQGVSMYPNAYLGDDVHAIFGHTHPERESYIQGLKNRIEELEKLVGARP